MSNLKNSRTRLSMDKDWNFHKGDIITANGKSHKEIYGASKAGGIGGPAGADWNDNGWEKVNLPHDWVVGQDFDKDEPSNQGCKPRGIGWYRKSFKISEEDKGKQLLLEFDGICTYSTIYFNGSVLERNWCGYTSFTVDISDRALYGEQPNILAVKVDAEAFEGWWYEGAGIYRHVWLTKKSPLHLAHNGVWINPQKIDENLWETKIETTVESKLLESKAFSIKSTIFSPEGAMISEAIHDGVCQSYETSTVKQSIVINSPQLWDIDTPTLYTLKTELLVDENEILIQSSKNSNIKSECKSDFIQLDFEEAKFGFRTISICPDKGFFLNEKPLKLKGTCNHHDHAGLGIALPDSIIEYRIQRLKDMGSNAYRSAHGNASKELIEICDRLGMLVMDENRNFESTPDGLKQLESMVLRDRSHPSVVFYSLFNEEPLQGSYQGRSIALRQMHAVRRLDPTRLITGAFHGGFFDEGGCINLLDASGFNYNVALYEKFHEQFPNQPLIGTETNSLFQTRGVYITDKEKQIFSSYDDEKAFWGNNVRENWKIINENDYVAGMFIWTGFDYRGEPTPYTWPSINCHFGFLDTCGFPKDAFYLQKACWVSEPVLHIIPHWNWQGKEGQPIRVMSHTNCQEVELFLNGKSFGKKASSVLEQAEWFVPYEAGQLEMHGFNNGIKVQETKISTASEPVALKIEAFRDYIFNDGLDAIPLNVSAIDKNGNFVPTASNWVKFTALSNNAEIIGVGNGDPNCHEQDVATKRSLFNGRCQGILKSSFTQNDYVESSTKNSMVKVLVESKGLNPYEIEIDLKVRETVEFVPSVNKRFIGGWRMNHKIFSERPDPFMIVDDSDMNTWEPIELGTGTQKKFDGLWQHYGLYETDFEIDEELAGKYSSLCFSSIMGHAEIYINGELKVTEPCLWPSQVIVPLGDKSTGYFNVRVLLKTMNEASIIAGICSTVTLE